MVRLIRWGVPLIGGLAVSVPLSAEVSSNVALTTDYIFRGISQSDENPSLQGGFDYTHESGLFAGVWGSNVDFNDNDQASLELDYYLGFAGKLQEMEYEASYIYYDYPGAGDADYDYQEVAGKLSIYWMALGLNFSDDYFAESGTYYYPWLELSYELPQMFNLGLHVGFNDIDDNDRFGTDDYTDWSLSIAREFQGVNLDLRYIDTDLDDEECFGGTDLCEERVVLTASRKF